MSRGLLLVDLQNDFLAAPGLDPGPDELIRRAAALLARCRRAGVPVLHARTTVTRAADERMPHWRAAGRWECVEGTAGHEFPAALRPAAGEPVFDKVFFSAFSNVELGPALEAHGIDELILAGVHLHACIRATALDAYARGLRVTVAADATAGHDGLHAAVSRGWLAGRGVRFATAAQLGAELGPQRPPAAAPGGSDPSERAELARLAVGNATAAGVEWTSMPPGDRAQILTRAAALIGAEAERLAALITAEVGKPIHYSRLEVARAVALLEVAARLHPPADERTPEATLRRLPVGLVAQITPWNNPLAVPVGKLAPALAVGNPVVWKPSPLAPLIANALEELLGRAGLPPGAVTIAHGGPETAEALAGDARVAAVSLTGSSAAGYAVQAICAARRVPIQAELGGNNGAIVWGDCDLEAAASAIAEAGFGAAGQRCTANRRAIVERRRLAPFVEHLSAATAALPLGSPLDPETRIGPLINAAARERVAAVIERATADCDVRRPAGSPAAAHLEAPPGADRYLEPAIVIEPAPDSEVVQRESFGPIVVVQPAEDFSHALELLNGVGEGLVAALFTDEEALEERFLAQARAGVLKLGRATADVGVETPFGGWGNSGVGPPEHGEANLEFYTRRQAIYA